MNRTKRSVALAVILVCGTALLLPSGATGQQSDVPGESPMTSDESAASKTTWTGNLDTINIEEPATLWPGLLPDLRGPTLTWIAVVVILVLTLQTKPLLSWHNLDGLMLALTALLLPLRSNLGVFQNDPTGQTVQLWAYLLLSVVGLYWLARGLRLLFIKAVPALGPNVSEGAMIVLIVAGLFVAGGRIANAPLSDGSRDGLIGGIFTAETGKLPYGDALGHDARSPLLYLLHAGAVKLVEPTYGPGIEMRWADRSAWLNESVLVTADPTTARLVNMLLFLLLIGAVAGLGHRLHSVVLGQTLVAILCIFPGVLECLPRPEIMLPTVLLAWSIAFVTVPGVGGLLSVLTLVLAGLAWPWAWLALPAMLAYFFRRGWQAFGATIGLLGAAAALLVGMTTLVAPTLPRADGALRGAGIIPTYTARLSDDGTTIIERSRPSETIEPTFKKWFWKPLLDRDNGRLDSASARPALPNGVDAASIMYRDVTATGEAREALQGEYRAALAREPKPIRAWASLRTLLEATWKPEIEPPMPMIGTWDLWPTGEPGSVGRWALIRRGGKIVVVVLALLVAFVLIRGRRGQLHQLIGGLLAVCAATLLISTTGTATNWVWLMPTALAALAAKGGSITSRLETPASERPPLDLGPAPRITVEK